MLPMACLNFTPAKIGWKSVLILKLPGRGDDFSTQIYKAGLSEISFTFAVSKQPSFD
jgi:hypothetical protein